MGEIAILGGGVPHSPVSLEEKNVFIGKNCVIPFDVQFDTSFGGRIDIGDDCWIFSGVKLITFGGSIKLGPRSTLNPYCVVYGHGGLVIGNDVSIATHTVIIPSNHNFYDKSININMQGEASLGIVIEDNCWLGARVTILDGVVVKKGSVIGAGSVVCKGTAEYSVNVGVPSRQIKLY